MDFFKFVHINKSPQGDHFKPISKEHTLKPNAGIVLTYPFFFLAAHTHTQVKFPRNFMNKQICLSSLEKDGRELAVISLSRMRQKNSTGTAQH